MRCRAQAEFSAGDARTRMLQWRPQKAGSRTNDQRKAMQRADDDDDDKDDDVC